MKSAVIIAICCSVLAMASPVKKDIVTVWETHTVVVTMYYAAHTTIHQSQPFPPAWIGPISTSISVDGSSTSTSPPPISSSISSSMSTSVPPSASSYTTSSNPSSASLSQCDDVVDYSTLSPYAAPILKQHNLHRCNHTAPAMQWDDELANWAKEISDTCYYAHNREAGDGQYGQNIGAGAPAEEVADLITINMYNGEIIDYPGYDNEPDMTNFESWGHFTQIVWKSTTSVGCYTTNCTILQNTGESIRPYFTVCNYRPTGNFIGQFHANVLKPVGEETIFG